MKSIALSIAGSDPSGGAGVQLDLKVFEYFRVYGMGVISSLTIQNSKGVYKAVPIEGKTVYEQIEALYRDFSIGAAKTGMLLTEDVVVSISKAVEDFKIKNLVVDPVLISTSGKELLEKRAVKAMIDRLIPLSILVTPNIPEAEFLTGLKINKESDIEKVVSTLKNFGAKNILIKGGHADDRERAVDWLFVKDEMIKLEYPRVKKKNIHGTGCALSAAITANLSLGKHIIDATRISRSFLQLAIENSIKLGEGAYYLDF